MLTTKRKPATVGEILVEEFMQPMRLTSRKIGRVRLISRDSIDAIGVPS